MRPAALHHAPERHYIRNPYGFCRNEDGWPVGHEFIVPHNDFVCCSECGGILKMETLEQILRREAAWDFREREEAAAASERYRRESRR